MLANLLLVAALNSNPVALALEQYARVESYRVTLRSSRPDGGGEVVRYAFRRPGFVRMEFVSPHRGALLVYDPRVRQATLLPFGPGSFPRLALSPGNPLIRSPTGHTVDRSDIGALLDAVRQLQQPGTTQVLGEALVGGRPALRVVVEGAGLREVAGVHRYELWLERDNLLPLKAESRDAGGGLIESVLMDDLETRVEFPDGFFAP